MAGKQGGKKKAAEVKPEAVIQEAAAPAAEEAKKGIFINGVSKKNVIPAKNDKGVCVRHYLPSADTPENQALRQSLGVDDKTKYIQTYYNNPAEGGTSKGHIYPNKWDPENKVNVLVGTVGKENEQISVRTDDNKSLKITVQQLLDVVEANKAEFKTKNPSKDTQASREESASAVAPSAVGAIEDPMDELIEC